MKNRFALHVFAGASSVAIALPLFIGTASAAPFAMKAKTTPTVACIQAMATEETAQIAKIDTQTAARKAALQAHVAALTAAAAMTDDAQRAAAIATADEDLNKAMQAMMTSNNTDAIDAVRTACGHQGGMVGQMDTMHKKWQKNSSSVKGNSSAKKSSTHKYGKKSFSSSSSSN